jgi:hypothetical protein
MRELTQAQRDWLETVNAYLEGCETASPGPCPDCKDCEDCLQANGEYHEDPFFSWQPCEICKGIAGDRESWHCIIDGKIAHGTCCQDCVCYLANGDIPERPE